MKIVSCLGAVALVLAGCASYEPSSPPVPKKTEYKTYEVEGLSAGALPYVDPKLQEATFDADLDAADILAIEVYVENGRGESVLVRPSDATLSLPNGKSIAPSGVSSAVAKIDEEGSVIGATIAFGIVGALVAQSAEDDAKAARRSDYEAKSLPQVELNPGESKHGFLWFLPPRGTPAFDKAELSIRFIDPGTGRSWRVEIPLSGLSFEPAS